MAEANVTLAGDDLRIEFPGQAVLILSDFAAMAEQGTSPLMLFADGSVIAGDILLTALTAELPEVAAGAAGASGGAGEYRDDMGNLIDGVDRLGAQDPDPFAREVELVLDDEQTFLAPSIGIVDPDNPDAALANIRLPEGDVALWGIKISDAPGGSTITLALSDGTAKLGEDYTLDNFVYKFAGQDQWTSVTGPIVIPAGDSLLLVKTNTVADDAPEPDEFFYLTATLTAPGGASYSASATATIYDEPIDAAVTFSIAANVDSISEDLQEAATFTVSRTGGTLAEGNLATVTIAGSGSATGGTDYSPALASAIATAAAATPGVSFNAETGVLTFTGAANSLSFTVTAVDDNTVEGTETIVATLSNAGVTYGTASITTPSDTVDITELDAAVTFSVTTTSEITGNDTPTQQATISEFSTADDMATFTISKGGDSLLGDNTATVTISLSGTAKDADFTGMSGTDYGDILLAIKGAAEAAGLTVTNVTATSLDVTWGAGDPDSFYVNLTAFNDNLVEGSENLTLSLSGQSVLMGSASLVSGQEIATINIEDYDPRILDGVMKTNTNVQNQFITMTFAEVQNPLHAAAKIYDLSLQGQQGSVVQDVGFNIDPSKHYNVALEASAGTKAIVTELTLEGVVIQGSGNAQLEINNTAATNSTSTAITAVIDPQDSAIQAKTVSIDGDAGSNTLTDTTPGTFTYLFGADGADTLNGSSGQEILNGGGGLDTLNGGGGNDILVFDSQNNDVIRGGDGFDLLRIDDGALYLSQKGSALPGNLLGPADNFIVNLSGKNIQGIEGILITEEAGASKLGTDPNDDVGTTIILNAQDVLDYTNGDTIDDNLLYILGSPGDVVQLGGATWEFVGTLPADTQGQAFTHWTAQIGGETANVYVETEVQVQTI
jgi:hypothetical protein